MKSCYDTIIYRKYVYRLLFDKRQLCAHPDGVRKDKKVRSIHVNYLSYNTLCPLLRFQWMDCSTHLHRKSRCFKLCNQSVAHMHAEQCGGIHTVNRSMTFSYITHISN